LLTKGHRSWNIDSHVCGSSQGCPFGARTYTGNSQSDKIFKNSHPSKRAMRLDKERLTIAFKTTRTPVLKLAELVAANLHEVFE